MNNLTNLEMLRRCLDLELLEKTLTARTMEKYRNLSIGDARIAAAVLVEEFDTWLVRFSRKDHPEADEELLFDEF